MNNNLTQDATSDRVRLPMSFDINKMLADVHALNLGTYVYYDSIPLRGPAHIIDPSLPHPPPAGDYADGSWTEWLDSGFLKASPYLLSIVDSFRKHTKVTLVRILRLAPNSDLKEHTDPTLALHIEKSVVRLTIPILNEAGTAFFLNDSQVPMKPGECWYLRLSDRHRVSNHGSTDRINLTIDMIPNEWLRNLIHESIEG